MSPYQRTIVLTKTVFSAILIITGICIFRSCDKKKIKDITNEELKNNEQTAIIVDSSGKITAITRRPRIGNTIRSTVLRGGDSKPQENFVKVIKGTDGAKETRVSVDTDGVVRLSERTYGLINEFGTGIYASTSYARIFVDDQVFFYRRHGLNINIGITLNGSKDVRPGIAYSYLLPFKYLSNSSIIIGIDSDHDVFIGHRVRF